ncbi:hypothetical protein Vi05172_g7788 [Venturia inaequalis]|nr:hypothetical protein Vi05172_g7788 [Venturia inaequalis]
MRKSLGLSPLQTGETWLATIGNSGFWTNHHESTTLTLTLTTAVLGGHNHCGA